MRTNERTSERGAQGRPLGRPGLLRCTSTPPTTPCTMPTSWPAATTSAPASSRTDLRGEQGRALASARSLHRIAYDANDRRRSCSRCFSLPTCCAAGYEGAPSDLPRRGCTLWIRRVCVQIPRADSALRRPLGTAPGTTANVEIERPIARIPASGGKGDVCRRIAADIPPCATWSRRRCQHHAHPSSRHVESEGNPGLGQPTHPPEEVGLGRAQRFVRFALVQRASPAEKPPARRQFRAHLQPEHGVLANEAVVRFPGPADRGPRSPYSPRPSPTAGSRR